MSRFRGRNKTKKLVELPRTVVTRTNDGRGVWPNHLAKMWEVVDLANRLLNSRRVMQLTRPDYVVSRDWPGGISITFIYEEEGRVDVFKQVYRHGRLWFDYVDKDCLDECLDTLKRELVLDSLANV